MEHTIDRIEWVENYLQGKIVTLKDLKDFFKIENNEKRIVESQIRNGFVTGDTDIMEYKLKDCIFTVEMSQTKENDKEYMIEEVYCRAYENN